MEYIIALVVYFLFAMLTAYIIAKGFKNNTITRYDSLSIIIISMLWIIFIPLIIMIELGKERAKRKKEKSDDNEQ